MRQNSTYSSTVCAVMSHDDDTSDAGGEHFCVTVIKFAIKAPLDQSTVAR